MQKIPFTGLSRARRWLFISSMAAALVGCGGGNVPQQDTLNSSKQAEALHFDQATASDSLLIDLQQAADPGLAIARKSATRLASVATQPQPPTADEFMTFAEQLLGPLFPGPGQTAANSVGGIAYTFRLYALADGSWNMIAVTNTGGQVYAIGELTGFALVQFGALGDYTCAVHPGRCVASAYAPGSVESKYFSEINDARIRGGFGAVAQNTIFDTAALNHANFIKANELIKLLLPDGTPALDASGQPVYVINLDPGVDPATGWIKGHVETPGSPGFTGILPVDRVNAAGLLPRAIYAGEVISTEPVKDFGQIIPDDCVQTLLSTVFHRGALLTTGVPSVGIGLALTPDGRKRACVIDLSAALSTALPADWSGIYPGAGQANVPRAMWQGETPNPAVEFAVLGQPLSLFVAPGHVLSVNSFTISEPGGAQLATKLIRKADFPTYVTDNQAYLVPNGALKLNTTYTVRFFGTDNGKALNKIWTFTTTAADGR